MVGQDVKTLYFLWASVTSGLCIILWECENDDSSRVEEFLRWSAFIITVDSTWMWWMVASNVVSASFLIADCWQDDGLIGPSMIKVSYFYQHPSRRGVLCWLLWWLVPWMSAEIWGNYYILAELFPTWLVYCLPHFHLCWHNWVFTRTLVSIRKVPKFSSYLLQTTVLWQSVGYYVIGCVQQLASRPKTLKGKQFFPVQRQW